MNLKNKRVFVSGGSGVIGRYLVDKLYKIGAKILVGDLQMRPDDWPEDIEYWQGDLNLLSVEEITRFSPEYFFHLAATFERSSETYEFWSENFHHNVALSHHLMTLVKDLPTLKRVVFASSYLIYDPSLYQSSNPTLKSRKLYESDIISPRNLTGMAKLNHEIELKFLEIFQSSSFTSVYARIYRSYGFGSRDVVSRWVRSLLRNEQIQIYSPENKFDFIYAEDVAEGLLRLALTPKATGCVNLGRGRSRSINEVIAVLKKQFPNLKSLPISGSTGIFESSEADLTRLTELTSWQPTQDIEQVIPKIIAYEKNSSNEAQKKQVNVLVTSASNKIPLVREIKKALAKATVGKGKVFGGDIDTNCLSKYFVDEFWVMPKLNKLPTSMLIKYCQENDITMIIPTRDAELEFYAGIRDTLLAKGIHVMVSTSATIGVCTDKLKFYQQADKKGYRAIPTYLKSSNVVGDKLVVKERYGAGSRKAGINISVEEAEIIAKELESPIFQPYVHGFEISVDAYVNNCGVVKGVIMRKRNMVINGESQITTTYENPVLEKEALTFLNSYSFYGHVMFQAIIDSSSKPHIIECNPRFGGASTLSVSAGLDSFYWFILESLGQDLGKYSFNKSSRQLRQIRYKDDHLVAV